MLYEVITIAASLIGHLLAAANGAAVARGSSWLKDSLGQQVLPEGLSVIEDPFRPRIAGSRPFDAEGLPTVITSYSIHYTKLYDAHLSRRHHRTGASGCADPHAAG